MADSTEEEMPFDENNCRTRSSYPIRVSSVRDRAARERARKLQRENDDLRAEVKRLRALASRAGYQTLRRKKR